MDLCIERDLWERLAATDKKIVMYGMGNGADKILRACDEKGVTVCDFFASDGFVRGHLFHGKRVRTWGENTVRCAAAARRACRSQIQRRRQGGDKLEAAQGPP